MQGLVKLTLRVAHTVTAIVVALCVSCLGSIKTLPILDLINLASGCLVASSMQFLSVCISEIKIARTLFCHRFPLRFKVLAHYILS